MEAPQPPTDMMSMIPDKALIAVFFLFLILVGFCYFSLREFGRLTNEILLVKKETDSIKQIILNNNEVYSSKINQLASVIVQKPVKKPAKKVVISDPESDVDDESLPS